jgi:tRNA pseudouridine synthase 10
MSLYFRLETQAGTYIKEFVHGDFGRTTPSVGQLMGLEPNQVGILQLDVEAVDLEWPPDSKMNGCENGK